MLLSLGRMGGSGMSRGTMKSSGFRIPTDEEIKEQLAKDRGVGRRTSERQLALYGGGIATAVLTLAQLRALDQTSAVQWSAIFFALSIPLLLAPAAEASWRIQMDPESTFNRPEHYWLLGAMGMVALGLAVLCLIAAFNAVLALLVAFLGALLLATDGLLSKKHVDRRTNELREHFLKYGGRN